MDVLYKHFDSDICRINYPPPVKYSPDHRYANSNHQAHPPFFQSVYNLVLLSRL